MTLRRRLADYPYWHETVLAGLLVALLAAAAVAEPLFVAPATQLDLASHVWELALLALPMTLIVLTGGIDLSIGSAVALGAVALGLVYEATGSPWLGAGAALAACAAAGALNGLFVSVVRVHPLIVTLATLAAFRGIAIGISGGRPISGYPPAFAALGGGTLLGAPIPAVVFAAAAAVTAVVLWRTTLGRAIYAIGNNETACRFSGVPVGRVKLMLYTLSGLAAGAAAVLYVSRRNTAKADIGAGWELEAITAVVLGGVSIFGGRGRLAGVLLGVLLIHETREFVSWRWQNEELIYLAIGSLLIGAVLLHTLLTARRRA